MKHLVCKFVLLFLLAGTIYGQVTISLPTVTGSPNTETLAPITVTSITGLNVKNFQFQINYDKSVVYITNYSTSGSLISGSNPTTKIDTANGFIRIAWASSTALSGSGALINLRIKFRSNDGVTNLTFSELTTPTPGPMEFGSSSLEKTWVNGSARVQSQNFGPVFDPINSQTVNEGVLLSFAVNATDPENDPITYSASNLPEGADFNTTTKVFSWTPNNQQSGNYIVDFSASDGNTTAAISVMITVVNVNAAPTFTRTLPDTTVQVHNVPVEFSYQYEAVDPDGDAITYAFIAGPSGSKISPSGLFTWSPAVSQAGQPYNVIVAISDGTQLTRDTAVVKGSDDVVGVRSDYSSMPKEYALHQNFPNPFNPTTNIKFALPKGSSVKLRVYSILGEEVALLVNKVLPAGNHTVDFDAAGLPTGMYVYRIEAENFVSMKKMLLVK
ncbi:MAG: T9SS type A sorting domain-containing protein [Ignavibacteriales bacterium]|nr:T9SS type A sorting domain-containing protein [Ignavibacteriales bacterium]